MSLENAMTEIVGVQIGTKIYRDMTTIKTLLAETNTPFTLIPRAQMQLMACCDLGPQWKQWADAPTLFIKKENGEYEWPKTT